MDALAPALREHEVIRTGDLASDPRWPRFGDRAAELGILLRSTSQRLNRKLRALSADVVRTGQLAV